MRAQSAMPEIPSKDEEFNSEFPKLKIWHGTQRGLNKDIVEVLVTLESQFGVSAVKSQELHCYIGNILF